MKDLFAGISLDGSVVSIDDDSNRRVYGQDLNGEDILLYGRAEMNAVVAPFVNALEHYSPRPEITFLLPAW